jgi:predicted PurR-regulated permease PerM
MARDQQPAIRRTLRIEVATPTLLKALCVVGFVWLLLQIWPILLVIAVALMLVGMLAPPIAWLERRGLRRPFAIATVFFGVFVVVALFAALTVPSLVAQILVMLERLPQAQNELADQLARTRLTAPLARSVRSTGSTELTEKLVRGLLSSSTTVAEDLAYVLTCLFLAAYLIIDRDRMRGGLFALVPRGFHVRLSRILVNLETIVGGYTRGQVITSAMMGVFTFIVLTIAHVPNALALAVFAGVADVLPYVGALLACGPAVLAAWSRGLPVTVAVLISLASYQEFESRVIVPRIYGRALRLPAATIMIALLVGGKLLGILGALLALPIAAGIRMVAEELRFELPGEDIDDSATRRRDAREERVFERLAAGAPAQEAAAIATEIAEARVQDERHPVATTES